MLLSFAILAVVGSTLAFKARFGPNAKHLCTTTTVNLDGGLEVCEVSHGVNTFCPNFVLTTTINLGKGSLGVWCTTTAQDFDGDGISAECFDPVANTTLPCFGERTLYTD